MTGVYFTEPLGTPADAWKVRVSCFYNYFDSRGFGEWMPPWATTLLEVLDSTSYKPWYGLQAVLNVVDNVMASMPGTPPEIQYAGSYLGLAFRAPDASAWGTEIAEIKKIGRRVIIPPKIMHPSLPREYYRAWVKSEIHKLEAHEADEFLRFDGERLATPH